MRGVNKQQIFECTEDYQRFLNILRTLTVREQDESGHRSKYGRIGHLFQERFKSQPVGDWGYFREYKWSSWLEYIGQEKNAFCAINVVLSRISLEELSNLIVEPLAEKEEEGLLDIEERPATPMKRYGMYSQICVA